MYAQRMRFGATKNTCKPSLSRPRPAGADRRATQDRAAYIAHTRPNGPKLTSTRRCPRCQRVPAVQTVPNGAGAAPTGKRICAPRHGPAQAPGAWEQVVVAGFFEIEQPTPA